MTPRLLPAALRIRIADALADAPACLALVAVALLWYGGICYGALRVAAAIGWAS